MKAVVIGAGVLGASTAYQLARRGVDVTVVDKGVPGDAASAASFAWLNSHSKEPKNYHDLNVISMAEWDAVARDLGKSDWLHKQGNVDVVDNAADAQKLINQIERLNFYGYAAIPVTPRELSQIDPLIRMKDAYELAAFYPGEGHITVPLLIHDLLRVARDLGATVRGGSNVVGLIGHGDQVGGVVLEDGDRIDADVVVLAAGAGIGDVMKTQGIDVVTAGTPGLTVTTSPGTSNLTTMLHLPGLSVRPDTSGRLVIRSSKSDTQIDRSTWTLPDEAIRELIAQTADGVADVDATAVRGERVQIATRPYPLDGLPVIGFWDGVPGLYVMTMHSGVTMGALMGRLAAHEIATGQKSSLLDDFRPARVITKAADGVPHFDPYAIEGETASQR
jgi:glycine/D-amino acid oxidase-like deaminating enzyme